MSGYTVTGGIIHTPAKVVLYGPEGIGKSTFASRFPSPVFIDTEGGTKKLDVQRLPAPTSWAMLLDEVDSVRKGEVPCGTLVIDTADWAERLAIRAVCDRANVKGIEDFGYGKGYTYVKEEFGRLLDLLEDVVRTGRNIVVTAHAQITKFEQPDELGAYDRWTMKTSKQVAPLLREWCDMLLFANYKTIVVKDGDKRNTSNKVQGGRRVLYTTHHPCWDAKNRDGLADELPLDYASIADVIPDTAAPASPTQAPAAVQPHPVTIVPAAAPAVPAADAAPGTGETPPLGGVPVDQAQSALEKRLSDEGIPEPLRPLMMAHFVEPQEIQDVVAARGYFPADMPIRDYPPEFVSGVLVNAWEQVYGMISDRRDLPF